MMGSTLEVPQQAGSVGMWETRWVTRWVAIPKTRKIRRVVRWSIMLPFLTGETVVSDDLRNCGRDCNNAGEGFRIFRRAEKMLRHIMDKNGEKTHTRLNITSIVSLPFLLFGGIRFPKVEVLVFAIRGQLCSQLTMIGG